MAVGPVVAVGFCVARGGARGVARDGAGDEDFEAGQGGDDETGAHFCCAHDGWVGDVSWVVLIGGKRAETNLRRCRLGRSLIRNKS